MKKIVAIAAVVTGLALLSGCATPTPYQPSLASSGARSGYSDVRLEDGRYRLSFAGNDLTPRETVETYLLYHAADLTLTNGYDWFEIVKRDTDAKRRVMTTMSDPFMDSMSWRFYGRRGWSVWSTWGFNDFERDTYEYTRYEATAEILMHKGPKPDGNANAYDARSVKSSLEAKIVRPTAK